VPNLIVLTGLRRGIVVPVGEVHVIGRSGKVDLRLPDFLLGPEHARIESSSEGFRLRDLASTNGTFRNGTRVHGETALCLGDVIHVGSTDVLFTEEGALTDSILAAASSCMMTLTGSSVDESGLPQAGASAPTMVLPLVHAIERAFSRAGDLDEFLERVAVHFARTSRGSRVQIAVRRGEAPLGVVLSAAVQGIEVHHDPGSPEAPSSELVRALGRQGSYQVPEGDVGSVYCVLPRAHEIEGVIAVFELQDPLPPATLSELDVVASLAAVYFRNHLLLEDQARQNRALAEAQRRLTRWNEELQLAVASRTAEVQRSARSYRELFEDSQDGIFTVDPRGALQSVNRRAAEVLGPLATVDSEFWSVIGEQGTRLLFGGQSMSPESYGDWLGRLEEPRLVTFLVRDEARERAVELLAQRIHPQDQLPTLHCVVRDVTLRYETEQKMRLFSRVVESVPDAVVTMDPEGVITSWNPGAQNLYGYSAHEVVGELIPIVPDARVGEFERLLEAAAQGRTLEFRTTRVGHDDREIRVQSTIAPVPDGAGNLGGLVEITRDLRAQLNLEERMRWKERMASFGELAAGLAHEVGNPLANLLSGVELLLARPHAPDEANEVHRVLRSEIKRLQRLVRQTLTLARWKPPDLEEVPLPSVLDFVANAVRPRAAEASISVIREDTALGDLTIEADPDQLKQALVNLASNALEAMEAGGQLTLACDVEPHQVLIEVRDTGKGISSEDLPRVYDLYYSRRSGGSGIGLSIVKRIIEAHQGKVEVMSELGAGTTFQITLPRSQEGQLK
jgi:PAS domain S-box-containing protein